MFGKVAVGVDDDTVDRDVVEVYDCGTVKHITEDIVHETLKHGRGISESLWND